MLGTSYREQNLRTGEPDRRRPTKPVRRRSRSSQSLQSDLDRRHDGVVTDGHGALGDGRKAVVALINSRPHLNLIAQPEGLAGGHDVVLWALDVAAGPTHVPRSRDSGSTETSQLVMRNSQANDLAKQRCNNVAVCATNPPCQTRMRRTREPPPDSFQVREVADSLWVDIGRYVMSMRFLG
jgi:hypothetical protein